jgi:hypothetical protein
VGPARVHPAHRQRHLRPRQPTARLVARQPYPPSFPLPSRGRSRSGRRRGTRQGAAPAAQRGRTTLPRDERRPHCRRPGEARHAERPDILDLITEPLTPRHWTAKRPQVLDADAARRILLEGGEGVFGAGSVGSGWGVVGCSAPAPVPRLWTGPVRGLSVIPSLWAWSAATGVRGGRGQSMGATTPRAGVMTYTTRAHRVGAAGSCRRRSGRRRGRSADLSVA